LRRWFEDDDALERALNGEYVLCALSIFFLADNLMMRLLFHYQSSLFCRWFLLPCGNEAVASQPIGLSRDENKPCVVGYAFQFNLITKRPISTLWMASSSVRDHQHMTLLLMLCCGCRSVSHDDFPGMSMVIPAPEVIQA